jgi:hypothetical protein
MNKHQNKFESSLKHIWQDENSTKNILKNKIKFLAHQIFEPIIKKKILLHLLEFT